jgi:hypothetical protein
MIVAAWLSKHFPDLVEPQFTASMEDSLDRSHCTSILISFHIVLFAHGLLSSFRISSLEFVLVLGEA